jgi:hypothetical protein
LRILRSVFSPARHLVVAAFRPGGHEGGSLGARLAIRK